MKILFVGLGSIARRHIRNLKCLDISDLVIDVVRHDKGEPLSDDDKSYIHRVAFNASEADEHYDAVFITNPTALHYDTLRVYNDKSNLFFIEKPVFLTGDEDISGFRDTRKVYYVACPLRYASVIQWLKKNMDFTAVYAMRAISSSYLPDWRPGEDYRETYSAQKALGGGVSIDLIHEWDYISYLVGFPKAVQSLICKKSNLELETDDVALYIAEYEDKTVELHLDYFGRKSMRQIELYTKDDTIVVDIIGQEIKWLRSGKLISFPQERDTYQKKELRFFLDLINRSSLDYNDLDSACRVLRIARGGR